MTTQTDNELMARIAGRDAAAFEVLFERYREPVRHYLARFVRDRTMADDLLQETFYRVWTRADQWAGSGRVKGWIFRIATNLALNHLRATARRKPLELPAEDIKDEEENPAPGWLVDTSSLGPAAVAEQLEQRARLQRLVDGLPEGKREVIRLFYDAEMEITEVSEALDIPEGTVKARLYHARRDLAREWRKDD